MIFGQIKQVDERATVVFRTALEPSQLCSLVSFGFGAFQEPSQLRNLYFERSTGSKQRRVSCLHFKCEYFGVDILDSKRTRLSRVEGWKNRCVN